MNKYKIEQISKAVVTVKFKVAAGWKQSFVFMSDNHHDSILCNRRIEREAFEKARKRNALIILTGDFFDAMQGKFDPRRNMDELRPEYRRQDYLDFVVTDAARFLDKYKSNLMLIGRGNHESSVRKNNSVDLIDRLALLLNLKNTGTRVAAGGYGGWVRILFRKDVKGNAPIGSINIKYFHGSGGEAPVTRGAIQTNRQAVYLPDADVVVNGHSHQNYIITNTRERLSQKSHVYFDNQYFIRVPGFKQGYADGTGGFDVETGKAPKPLGTVWMNLEYRNNKMHERFEPDVCPPEPVNPVDSYVEPMEPYPQDSEYP